MEPFEEAYEASTTSMKVYGARVIQNILKHDSAMRLTAFPRHFDLFGVDQSAIKLSHKPSHTTKEKALARFSFEWHEALKRADQAGLEVLEKSLKRQRKDS